LSNGSVLTLARPPSRGAYARSSHSNGMILLAAPSRPPQPDRSNRGRTWRSNHPVPAAIRFL
jgi:hypothetical protein